MIKKTLKKIIYFFFLPISFLFLFLWKIKIMSYKSCGQILSKIPGIIGIIIRQAFYNLTLKKCGKNIRVFYGAFIVYPTVTIGDNCTIEEFSIISNCDIGNDVIIAARVSIMSGAHHHDTSDIDNSFYNSKSSVKKISLGNNIWIGTHAIIMNNIGSHSVIGAGSVVTKEIDAYVVAVGVPAKIIKKRL
ncbi:acyltransferase [Proteus mirabilis]|uniref:WenJ n=1 Tax=Proteus vulgaris TaxID=585 RepID=D9YZ48_PROVU|nr:acyltransferase [Proteus vulgaris]ADL32335.1 WenJ [Proteus vulgaris]MBG5970522.1 acyltransferase [Proteus vulgaris]MDM3561529.1 acyltransferase [Proteus vulgaris]RNT31000.1 acyltransferase [Proteus mirabilis]